MLRRHACYALSHIRCNRHSLLLSSHLPRIGRIENPSCSACEHPYQVTSHLILHCPATDCLRRLLFGNFLSLFTIYGLDSGELFGFRSSMVFHHAPSFERGRVTTTTYLGLIVEKFQLIQRRGQRWAVNSYLSKKLDKTH